jgi:hypothetical protein
MDEGHVAACAHGQASSAVPPLPPPPLSLSLSRALSLSLSRARALSLSLCANKLDVHKCWLVDINFVGFLKYNGVSATLFRKTSTKDIRLRRR